MKYQIKNRWNGCVLFEAEIECEASASEGTKLGLAVKLAVKADANLADAYLADAYLAGAYLADAYLADAKWSNGIVITKAPLQISGLTYQVTVLDSHMQIGCELHTFDAWAAFDDDVITKMDGARARRFWRDHKAALMMLARSREVKQTVEAAE